MFAGRRLSDLVSIIALIASIMLVLLCYNALPNSMPMSFDSVGKAQAYGPKWSVWIPPVAALFIYLLLGLSSRVPTKFLSLPIKITDENRSRVLPLIYEMNSSIRMLAEITFFVLTLMVIRGATTGKSQLELTILLYATELAIVVTLVAYVIRMRRVA